MSTMHWARAMQLARESKQTRQGKYARITLRTGLMGFDCAELCVTGGDDIWRRSRIAVHPIAFLQALLRVATASCAGGGENGVSACLRLHDGFQCVVRTEGGREEEGAARTSGKKSGHRLHLYPCNFQTTNGHGDGHGKGRKDGGVRVTRHSGKRTLLGPRHRAAQPSLCARLPAIGA